jgi:3-isopropylmalate/(R)-2-methylmalate dehydratase large subunit
LKIIGDMGADGATYDAAEFAGEAIDDLSVDARFTISNMAIEMGAKAGIMNADNKTLDWVKKHSKKAPRPVVSDKDAKYKQIIEIDVSDLVPSVAKPHTVDNYSAVSGVEGTLIQQGVIGTCTNGRLEDLDIAAKILKGKKVSRDCRLIIAPASKSIFLEAMKHGIVETIMGAGGIFVTPGCGPCVGTHNGVPSDGEKVISSANRNFLGRMGNRNAEIYLASPATVAASAIEGKITDPRKYL